MQRLFYAPKRRSAQPRGDEVPPSETELQQQLADSEGMTPNKPQPEPPAKQAEHAADGADALRRAEQLGRERQGR